MKGFLTMLRSIRIWQRRQQQIECLQPVLAQLRTSIFWTKPNDTIFFCILIDLDHQTHSMEPFNVIGLVAAKLVDSQPPRGAMLADVWQCFAEV